MRCVLPILGTAKEMGSFIMVYKIHSPHQKNNKNVVLLRRSATTTLRGMPCFSCSGNSETAQIPFHLISLQDFSKMSLLMEVVSTFYG